MMRNSLFLLISFAAAAQADPPASLEITYQLTRNGSAMAEVVERLQYSAGNYQLTESWKGKGIYALLGTARRVSRGSVNGDVLRPREFFDERSGRDTARAWFDWKANTLTMQYKGDRRTEPLQPNAQDRLSFLLALSLLPGKAESISYHIADGKGISQHVYKAIARERIRTPAGEFEALKVARLSDKPEKESAELWLAAALSYIPVRLLIMEKDGSRFEQLATRIARP
jgi:hypothetical protein